MRNGVPLVQLSNGITMPQIGLGVWQAENGTETRNAVLTALKYGYRSIDTAAIYGNEESVGQAIRESGIDREELFVTTKVWNSDHGYESTLRAYEVSLKKLGLDFVDLYLIHWPAPNRDLYVDTWRALQKLYESGRVRAIGVSNFMAEHLDALINNGCGLPVINQIELHPHLQQRELRQYCREHNIAIESWSPLKQGGDILEHTTVKEIADKYNKTPAQIVLRWHAQNGFIMIPKSVTPKRIEENISIFDFELSSNDMESLDSLDREERIGPHPLELH